MPFDRNSAKKAGTFTKEMIELLHEKMLDDLLINQYKLTKSKHVNIFATFYNYILSKQNLCETNSPYKN